ncbi:hypothetical protein D3C72_1275280 [compost metagenome]
MPVEANRAPAHVGHTVLGRLLLQLDDLPRYESQTRVFAVLQAHIGQQLHTQAETHHRALALQHVALNRSRQSALKQTSRSLGKRAHTRQHQQVSVGN